MRKVRSKDSYWYDVDDHAHKKEEDFTKEEEKQGYTAVPVDLPEEYPMERPSVSNRNQGKEETYSRRKKA